MEYSTTKQNQNALVYVHGKWEEVDKEELERYKQINPNDWWIVRDNQTHHKYQIAIQCIARQEERYFKEWIEHHLNIGIEHIFIYDNNDKRDKYKLKEFLRTQLSAENFAKIEIIPWHEPMLFQQFAALKDCVSKHKYDVKWLLSIDLDEFLFLDKPMKEFLEEFSYASQVYFSWESFGAGGELRYTDRPITERFTTRFECKDDMQGKAMFRPDRMKSFHIHSVHMLGGKTVNVLHKEIKAPDSFANIHKTAWIKHYFTKSLEEWTDKMKRGCADHLWGRKYDMFFEINPELKEHYDPDNIKIQEHGNAPKENENDSNYFDKSPLDKLQFEVSITEHCNLNCAMCDHFSPLATESFLDIETFKKDIKRMAEIFDGEAEHICILGGEPTLHEKIEEFLEVSREYFKKAEIKLFTNGLTLKNLGDSFWRACKKNEITIYLTKYPCKKDWEKLEEFVISKDVKCAWPDYEPEKIMTHMPLDLSGMQDENDNFLRCYHANRNIQLKNGKLYTCTVAANIEHFNKYFNKNLEVLPNDSIDIHCDVTKEKILRFLSQPIQFCKNCDIKNRTAKEWSFSKRSIEEWT